MNREEFYDLKRRIRAYLDEHPFEREGTAEAVGGFDQWGGVTELFIIASAEVLEDLFARHVNN